MLPPFDVMIMEYPKRTHPRLAYNYSLPGYYYVTIHVQNSAICLSQIHDTVSGADIQLTKLGQIAETQLFELEKRYAYVKILKHVMMPTHIHAIIQLELGDTVRPGLTDIVCAYKSLTTRICNQEGSAAGRKLFQTSFYERILRNENDFQKCWQYIDQNPIKWIMNDHGSEFEP